MRKYGIQFMKYKIAITRKLYKIFHIFQSQKKNTFRGNYSRKYCMYVFGKTPVQTGFYIMTNTDGTVVDHSTRPAPLIIFNSL